MSNYSTIQIFKENRSTLHSWKRRLGLKSTAELINRWIEEVRCHKQREMYSRLPMPSGFKRAKPLEGVRIARSYKVNRGV